MHWRTTFDKIPHLSARQVSCLEVCILKRETWIAMCVRLRGYPGAQYSSMAQWSGGRLKGRMEVCPAFFQSLTTFTAVPSAAHERNVGRRSCAVIVSRRMIPAPTLSSLAASCGDLCLPIVTITLKVHSKLCAASSGQVCPSLSRIRPQIT